MAILVLASACAPKAPPAPVGAPKHPDFLFPAPPAGTVPAQVGRLERGWQYLQLGDLRNAEREFATALKQQPAFYPAEAALAYLVLARGNEKDAVTRFDRALHAEQAYVPALVGRGQALLELNRTVEALASFEAALAADPSLTDLRSRVGVLRLSEMQNMLARATSAADGRRWDEAIAAYQQAIAASPDSAFLYRDLAGVEQKAGRASAALEHYRRATLLDASDAQSHAAIGGILEAQGDAFGALTAYERAVALDRDAVPAGTLARARAAVELAKLPPEYRDIPRRASVSRADIAALIGVRLSGLLAKAKPRQLIITDIRGHWAQSWIGPVVRAGIMDTLPNYEFEPARQVRRGELATTVSRVLTLIAAIAPDTARKWQGARVTVADVSSTHLSYPAVSMAVAAGVMPLTNGAFELLRPVTGAEAADVVGRLEALAR
jgi:tetratricopeptide (TPR) repeat protein